MTSPRSLPGLRFGTQGRWSWEARRGPKKKLRASKQIIMEILDRLWVDLMWFARWEIIACWRLGHEKWGKCLRRVGSITLSVWALEEMGGGGRVSYGNWMVDIEFYFPGNDRNWRCWRLFGFRGYTMSAALWVLSSWESASFYLRTKNWCYAVLSGTCLHCQSARAWSVGCK